MACLPCPSVPWPPWAERLLARSFLPASEQGVFSWLLVNAVLWLALAAQLLGAFGGLQLWYYTAAAYAGLNAVHAVLTMRDG